MKSLFSKKGISTPKKDLENLQIPLDLDDANVQIREDLYIQIPEEFGYSVEFAHQGVG